MGHKNLAIENILHPSAYLGEPLQFFTPQARVTLDSDPTLCEDRFIQENISSIENGYQHANFFIVPLKI